MKTIVIVFLLLTLWIGTALAFGVNCPLHPLSIGVYKGNSFVSGVMVKIYGCPHGHDFMVKEY